MCVNEVLQVCFSTYVFSTGIAVLRVQGLVAGAAVRSTLPHDVTLAPQRSLALETTEVLHVPVSSFCLRTFICKNNLGLRVKQRERREREVTEHSGGDFMGTEVTNHSRKNEYFGFGLTRQERKKDAISSLSCQIH